MAIGVGDWVMISGHLDRGLFVVEGRATCDRLILGDDENYGHHDLILMARAPKPGDQLVHNYPTKHGRVVTFLLEVDHPDVFSGFVQGQSIQSFRSSAFLHEDGMAVAFSGIPECDRKKYLETVRRYHNRKKHAPARSQTFTAGPAGTATVFKLDTENRVPQNSDYIDLYIDHKASSWGEAADSKPIGQTALASALMYKKFKRDIEILSEGRKEKEMYILGRMRETRAKEWAACMEEAIDLLEWAKKEGR